MSAYGVFKQPHATGRIALSATAWPLKSQVPTAASTSNSTSHITIFHLTSETATAQRGLVDYLRSVFSDVVDEGLTYPQEDKVTPESFEAYFLAGDLLVGIHDPSATISGDFGAIAGREATTVVHQSLESAKGTKDWRDAIVGFYYVKPNYPGRSSHICNGGFVVPTIHRGKGYASALAKSFLHYAPALGYKASVFNLVYTNNLASVRLWDNLGFTKVGRIPNAGRLKRKDGPGEEYVDAWVIYRSFEEAGVEGSSSTGS
ncbi:hypothetical protein BDV98DRAFT_557331 [Pterulicium gracile]|uniref:N-acetyltransferase domain-containing protein n=1 Tax=Pterulicium gracile TaxID=1884261 RepID=A0A5C3R2K9_9AGAR|nr:hypothetical protein BDV98DRAFT_557331 [Pterula gracilis]